MKRTYVLMTMLAMALGCGAQGPNANVARKATEKDNRAEAPNAQAAGGGAPESVKKIIIFTAHLSLIVESFDEAESEFAALVEKHDKAYIAKSEITGSAGNRRRGSWTVRLPPEQLQAFLTEAKKLGELEQLTRDSDDVTDKYYDMENRVKNLKVREQGLRKLLLEKSSSKLEELLAVDRELNKVREEIEIGQGQMQRWSKLSDLATIVVTIQERRSYVPTTAPSFRTSVARTFTGSLDELVWFLQALVLMVVGLAPWLPLLAVLVGAVWLLVRRWQRSRPQLVEVVPVTPQDAPQS